MRVVTAILAGVGLLVLAGCTASPAPRVTVTAAPLPAVTVSASPAPVAASDTLTAADAWIACAAFLDSYFQLGDVGAKIPNRNHFGSDVVRPEGAGFRVQVAGAFGDPSYNCLVTGTVDTPVVDWITQQ